MTNLAGWTSSDDTIASVSATGLATPAKAGGVTVTATLAVLSATGLMLYYGGEETQAVAKWLHVAFGFGPHQCVGQTLARLELYYGLPRLFARYPGLRLVDEDLAALEYREGRAFFGLGKLLVSLGESRSA